jgi:hypothetical protein
MIALLARITTTTAANAAISLREIGKFAKADTSSSQASNRTRNDQIILPLNCTFISLSSILDPPAFNKIAIPANTEERESGARVEAFQELLLDVDLSSRGHGFFTMDPRAVLGASRSLSGASLL